jgi:hypothetical protein
MSNPHRNSLSAIPRVLALAVVLAALPVFAAENVPATKPAKTASAHHLEGKILSFDEKTHVLAIQHAHRTFDAMVPATAAIRRDGQPATVASLTSGAYAVVTGEKNGGVFTASSVAVRSHKQRLAK